MGITSFEIEPVTFQQECSDSISGELLSEFTEFRLFHLFGPISPPRAGQSDCTVELPRVGRYNCELDAADSPKDAADRVNCWTLSRQVN
jgi:hypothetical protein